MESFYRFFVRRPLFVNILMLLIIVGGIIASRTMQYDTIPKFDLGIVNITTFRPGASPEDMELSVTVPLEKELLHVDGIKKLTSNSMEGMSVIVAQLDLDDAEPAQVEADIQKAVDRASSRLPTDLPAKPVVESLSSAKVPVLEIHVSGSVPEAQIRRTARKLERGLREVPGVGGVERVGYREREMRIFLRPDRLYRLGISFDEVIAAVGRRNVRDSGGSIESFGAEKKVLTVGQFDEPRDVEDVIVRANGPGNYVRIRDIATVVLDYAERSVEARCDGVTGIQLLPRKKVTADGLDTAKAVRDFIAEIEPTLPAGIQLNVVNDLSRYTYVMLDTLSGNAIVGVGLVLVVLLLFFRLRLAFWVALGLPIAICLTFILMPLVGLGIDLLTISALLLMLGMLVDDAIVTGESIYAQREQGLSPVDAASRGTAYVALPVIVSTLTTVLVFLPLAFLGGYEGKFLWTFPVMIVLVLAASLFECQIMLPGHLAHGPKTPPKPKRWFRHIQNAYDHMIERLLRRKYLTIVGFLAVTAGVVVICASVVTFNLYPEQDVDLFYVAVELPEGTPFDTTRERVAELEDWLRAEVSEGDLSNITAQIGHHDTDVYGATEGRNAAWAIVYVVLNPFEERPTTSYDIIAKLRRQAREKRGFKSIRIAPADDAPVAGSPVNVDVVGNDEGRVELARRMATWLRNHPAVTDAWTSYKPGKDIVRLALDHAALADRGLTVLDVTRAVRVAFDGVVITTLQTVDEEIDYRLQFPPSGRGKLETLEELYVIAPNGAPVPLRGLARFEIEPGEAAIRHYLGDRTVTVRAEIDREKIDTASINAELRGWLDAEGLLARYDGLRLVWGGELKQQQEALGSTGIAFLFAMLGVFFLFAVLFNSMTQPLLIMAVIPFGFTGVLVSFALQGLELSMMALFGIIGLAGVLVNDSVVLIDGLNRRRSRLDAASNGGREWLTYKQIADGAGERLRPIIITSVTTVAGLAPAAYGFFGSNPFMTPVIMAMAWGVFFGTFVTLILLPALYAADQDMKRLRTLLWRWITRKGRRAATGEGAGSEPPAS